MHPGGSVRPDPRLKLHRERIIHDVIPVRDVKSEIAELRLRLEIPDLLKKKIGELDALLRLLHGTNKALEMANYKQNDDQASKAQDEFIDICAHNIKGFKKQS